MPRNLATARMVPDDPFADVQSPINRAGDTPFPIADLEAWALTEPEPRAMAVEKFVPAGEVTLFTGPGGVGKSLLAQQLATCFAASIPLLGLAVTGGNALYVTAEDDERELHWRQQHICRALGIPLASLAGKLALASIRGRLNSALATFDSEGRIRPAEAYLSLKGTIQGAQASLVILDNVAHLFAGNENDRGNVTAFANLLHQICRDLGCTVVLIGHPNKSGDSYSGSTAWLNAVRSQIVLERSTDEYDVDARSLSLGKANYARAGEIQAFRWHDFAFVRDSDIGEERAAEIAATAQASAENAAFLACLRERICQGDGRQVGPTPGPNYAPSQFEGMSQAKGLKRDRLKLAMDRLFGLGLLETHTYRNTSKGRDVTIIREALGRVSPNPELPPRTGPEHCSRSYPNSSPDLPRAHSSPLRGETGAAFGAAAPIIRGEILAPGEDGDEPIPGWDDR